MRTGRHGGRPAHAIRHPPTGRTRAVVNVFASEPGFGSSGEVLVHTWLPEASCLLDELRAADLAAPVGGKGDRMPRDGPPYLGEEDPGAIEGWILQGAGQ